MIRQTQMKNSNDVCSALDQKQNKQTKLRSDRSQYC